MNKHFFQYCFGVFPEEFPETVIVTPFLSVDKFKDYCEGSGKFRGKMYSGIIASKNGQDFSVVHCGIGDRLMGDAVLLFELAPVKKVIFVGSCGGLNDGKVGDLLVCENAFDGEGFTKYHMPDLGIEDVFKGGKMVSSSGDYTAKLKNFFEKNISKTISVTAGDIFTIGSFLAESRENLLAIDGKGFSGLEMELSAVLQAARKAGITAAGVVFVSDLPLKKPIWETLTSEDKTAYNEAVRELIRLSVDFAVTQ